MAAAWRPYTETVARAPDVQRDHDEEGEAVVVAALERPIAIADVGIASSPGSGLDEEILVAQTARRPDVPAQSVLLKAVQAESEKDLDAVLSKWGAKSAKKRDASPLHVASSGAESQGEKDTPEGTASATGDYGMETAWVCREVPGEEGVWECEERIVDSYLDRSGDSVSRDELTA